MGYKDFAFGLDVSHYDPTLVEEDFVGTVDFLTIKLGGMDSGIYEDAYFNSHVQTAWNLDIPCGAYVYLDPGYWLENQMTMKGVSDLTNENHPVIQLILRKLHAGTAWKPGVKWLALDVEEVATYNGTISTVWHQFTVQDIVDRLEYMMMKNQMPTMPIMVYSRKSFMTSYAPTLVTWLDVRQEVLGWPAYWWWNTSTSTPTTLAEIRTRFIPPDTYTDSTGKVTNVVPANWSAYNTWKFWQYSGERFTTPSVKNAQGNNMGLDLNLYNGTKAELLKWAGYIPHTGLPVEPSSSPSPSSEVPPSDVDLTEVNAKLDEINNKLDGLLKHFTVV